MHITRIQLTDFRNYAALDLAPCAGVTVLVGDNAQGKTNALEAVYLTCTGRSHRTRQDRELVRWGAPFAAVRVDAQRRDGGHDVEIIIPEAVYTALMTLILYRLFYVINHALVNNQKKGRQSLWIKD